MRLSPRSNYFSFCVEQISARNVYFSDVTNDELQQELTRVVAECTRLRDENKLLTEHATQQQQEIDEQLHRIKQLLRQIFGRRSERSDPAQLELAFLEATGQPLEPIDPELTALASEAPDDEETNETKRARRQGGGRRRLPEHLPLVERHFYPIDTDCCGAPMQEAGVESTEVLHFEPSSYLRLRTYTHKRACAVNNHRVVRATAPEVAFPGTSVTPALVAGIITGKFADHLPGNRQIEIAARQGVELSKATMCGWQAAGADALRPIVAEIKRGILTSPYVHVDDTGLTIQDKAAPGGSRKGYIWSYRGEHKDVIYEYSRRRQREAPLGVLRTYRGFVVADAYNGFDGLFGPTSGRVEVACFAHTRRKFHEAIATTPHAVTATAYILQLYRVEAAVKHATPEVRLAARQRHSVPIIERFKKWLDEQLKTALPKGPLAKAIRYALNQWEALKVYLTDGRLPIDNNPAERDLRRVAVGRKNWMFAGSDEGARRAALFYSLIQTCKLNDVNPFEYLRDVLSRVGTTPQARMHELTPRAWKAARAAEAIAVTASVVVSA